MDSGSTGRVVTLKLSQSLLHPQPICGADSKDARAALGTAGAAEQMPTTPMSRIGEVAVHQRDEGAVVCEEAG